MSAPFLAKGSRTRTVALCIATVVAMLVVTQFVLPGSSGSSGRGTPLAILFTGFVLGSVNSLTAAGLVLVYRTTRVINFAQTALGVAGAMFVFDVVQLTEVPFLIALPIGLVLSALSGILFEVAIVRRFFFASRLVLTVATIAAATVLAQFGPVLIRQLPFIPLNSASFEEAIGSAPVRDLLPFAGFEFTVGSLNLKFGFPEVFAIEMTIVALLVIAAFFRFTRLGVGVRALAENAERASLLGISVGSLSMVVWGMSGVLGGLSGILTGSILIPAQAKGFAPGVLLPALAAAVIARFRSFPLAVFAAVAITITSQAAQWSLQDDTALINVALLLIIGGGLLLQARAEGRSEVGGGVSWQAVDEQRPIPKELSSVSTVRTTRYVLIALGLVAVVAYPFVVSTGATVLGGNVAITSIIILSLVMLTGWSGQVSLGQYGFAAFGGVVGGALTAKVGIPFWFSIFIAAALTGALAVLVGLPALRIRGLFLAVTTFAFGLAITGVLFNRRYAGWLLADDVKRPTLLFIDFEDERSMYYLCLAALVLSIVLLSNIRRSRLGRTLIALRENEANVQSFGINVVRTKLLAFALSGAFAGFAGALLAFQGRGLTPNAFEYTRSVDVFLYAVFGGVSSVPGALIGSIYYNLTTYFSFNNAIAQTIFQNSGQVFVLLLLFIAPGGLISLINAVRDSALRIVAQRRRIVVPSLFADYDPEALEKRLIPLGPPSDLDGLAALPPEERFMLPSDLYQGSGIRILDRMLPQKASAEAAAIGGAAENVERETYGELPATTGAPS